MADVANYMWDALATVVTYEPLSLVELGLFLVTCIIVFLYSSVTRSQEVPPVQQGWDSSDCSVSQHCANTIFQLCQSRTSHHKALQMYLDHRQHLTNANNPHVNWDSFFYHLLIAISRCGPAQLSSESFAHRRKLGIAPNSSLYEVAMKMLAGKHQYTEALKVYDESVIEGLTLSPVSYSCLINFAIEVDQPHRAVVFFNKLAEITTPSIRAYMSILRLYSRKKMWKESVGILDHMQNHKVRLDSLILNIVLGACVRAEELTVAEQLLEKYEEVRDVISFNNILKGYAHTHQYQEALSMVERMKRSGIHPTMVTYNTVMDACVRSRQYQHAWEIAQSAEFPADKYTISILVKTVATMRWKIPVLLNYLSALKIDDPQSSLPVIFTTIIDALSEEPNLESLQRVMQEVCKRSVLLPFPCLTTLMRSLLSLGAAEQAFSVWRDLMGNRMPPSAFFETSLELALHFRHFGMNDKPFREIVQWVETKLIHPEVDTLIQLLLESLLSQNLFDHTMTIYYNMTNKALKCRRKPNFDVPFYTKLIKGLVGYDGYIDSCSPVQHAMKLIEDLRSHGLHPEPQSIICVLQACLRRGSLEDVKQTLIGFQLMGVKPSEHALATVLRIQLKVEAWDAVIALLQMISEVYGEPPTAGTVSLLTHAFTKANRNDKVAELADLMKPNPNPNTY